MRKLFFVGMLLVGLFCGTSVVLAKEDGKGECDAVYFEQVLAQVRGILASTAFLQELKPEMDDSKKVTEELVEESIKGLAGMVQVVTEMDRKEYDEAVTRYFGGDTARLRND